MDTSPPRKKHTRARTRSQAHTRARRPRAALDQSDRRQPFNTSCRWQPGGHAGEPGDCTPMCARA
eukprot:2389650-Pyramimonas_sp.AAC.1